MKMKKLVQTEKNSQRHQVEARFRKPVIKSDQRLI